ncbi:MAG: hypothetical protein ABIE68_04850 [bacterium]
MKKSVFYITLIIVIIILVVVFWYFLVDKEKEGEELFMDETTELNIDEGYSIPEDENDLGDIIEEDSELNSSATEETTNAKIEESSDNVFSDAKELFTATLPEGFTVTEKQTSSGIQLSSTDLKTTDYSDHSVETEGPYSETYIDKGAFINIHITTDVTDPTMYSIVESEKDFTVDGINGKLKTYTEPSTKEGKFMGIFITKGSSGISIRMNYNPDEYPNGPTIFEEFLNSISFS